MFVPGHMDCIANERSFPVLCVMILKIIIKSFKNLKTKANINYI
jgi:hypothetical protein